MDMERETLLVKSSEKVKVEGVKGGLRIGEEKGGERRGLNGGGGERRGVDGGGGERRGAGFLLDSCSTA